jgi:hypothetical protein
MKTHHLKTWPSNFDALYWSNTLATKNFEIRINDRDYAAGDRVVFWEWNPALEDFTGRYALVERIDHLVQGRWGLPSDLCVFGWTREPQFFKTESREHMAALRDELR